VFLEAGSEKEIPLRLCFSFISRQKTVGTCTLHDNLFVFYLRRFNTVMAGRGWEDELIFLLHCFILYQDYFR
jgi:hypothetical protein